jgi:DNA polymerase-1
MNQLDGYHLLEEGAKALSQIESNGIRIDTEHLETTMRRIRRSIKRSTLALKRHDIYEIWRRYYSNKFNLGSRYQLGKILFDIMKIKCTEHTKTGKWKADETILSGIDLPFVRHWIHIEKQKKLLNGFLAGIHRETHNGFLRPSFNLHRVITFRSSSDSPNFQNFPVRDPVAGKVIRSCFIPRKNHHLVEIDYSGIEVRVAACYHKDPTMLEYICDETKDMHRDMAAQCFMCEPEQVEKQVRYVGKNMFVFPQFYGDYYINNAKAMWEACTKMGLMIENMPAKRWLKRKGIRDLGACDPEQKPKRKTFEFHMKEVESDFWNRRFKVYKQWKLDWYQSYLNTGKFQMLTGFEIAGTQLKRNDVINYPVQGSAFHCLLWSLTRLQKWLVRNKMRSVIIGQIHDSIVADVHKDELETYLQKAKIIMTQDIMKAFPWLIVPLEIEAEVAPLGDSWFDKKEKEI